MATTGAQKADYGYEIKREGDRTIIEMDEWYGDVKGLYWPWVLIGVPVLSVWIGAMVDPYGWAGVIVTAAVLFGIPTAYRIYIKRIGWKGATLIIDPDTLSLPPRGGPWARKDIRNLRVVAPTEQVVTGWGEVNMNARLRAARKISAHRWGIGFDYGRQTVLLVDRLTEPQADAVAVEIVAWLKGRAAA